MANTTFTSMYRAVLGKECEGSQRINRDELITHYIKEYNAKCAQLDLEREQSLTALNDTPEMKQFDAELTPLGEKMQELDASYEQLSSEIRTLSNVEDAELDELENDMCFLEIQMQHLTDKICELGNEQQAFVESKVPLANCNKMVDEMRALAEAREAKIAVINKLYAVDRREAC